MDIQNHFLAFHANSGRIHDSIKNILTLYCLDEASKDKDKDRKLNTTATRWLKQLEDYYQIRNTVLHGKKLPFGEMQGILLIPIPEGEPTHSGLWHTSKSWDDIKESDFEYCSDYLVETYHGILQITNGIFGNILGIIKEIITGAHFELDNPPVATGISHSSGTGISGFEGTDGSSMKHK